HRETNTSCRRSTESSGATAAPAPVAAATAAAAWSSAGRRTALATPQGQPSTSTRPTHRRPGLYRSSRTDTGADRSVAAAPTAAATCSCTASGSSTSASAGNAASARTKGWSARSSTEASVVGGAVRSVVHGAPPGDVDDPSLVQPDDEVAVAHGLRVVRD